MKKNLYYIFYIGVLMMFLAGCQDEGLFTSSDDELVSVSYRVKVEDDLQGRSVGDGKKVDKLIVGVFQNGKQVKQYTSDIQDGTANINLLLLRQQTYDLVFWAHKDGNEIYNTEDLSNIRIDYTKYQNISLESTEDFEAFSLVRKEVTVDNPGEASIVLTHPFAQLNIAASEEELLTEGTTVNFTISKVYSAYNLLDATLVKEVGNQNFSFSISSTDVENKQKIEIEGTDYYYLASAYLFAPTEVALSGSVKGGDLEKELNFSQLPLTANTRTNIYGDMVRQIPWNESLPAEFTLGDVDEEGRYVIDEELDLVWLSVNGSKLSAGSKFIVNKDLNMKGREISSIQMPAESTFDGGGYTIKNFANSFFGNATNLTVQNLILDKVHAASDDHVGVLVNILTGSSSFIGVTVTNSSAITSDGAAGGMIGYITNKEGETLEVTFSGCTATNNKVNGSLTSGVYVGRFRGYDNSETLTFSSCNESSATITGTNPYYVEGNEATWLAENDYSNYSGWLGNEEYYRGTINYGNDRFIPKWDGTTTVDPIVENNVKLINSPYDVAKLQSNSHTAITFEADIDLGSHKFNPIKSITTLDGKGHTIYNLKVDMVHDGTGAAFIQSASGTTTHKDIIFVGADIKNVHNPNIPTPAYGVTNDGGAGNAYAGTLVSHSGGTYNVSNVHVKSGKVYAVCKMGGLVGYVGGNLNMSDCSVDDYIIENYCPNVPNYYEIPPIVVASWTVHGLQWWYTNGECGGLIGFVKSPEANIVRCSVTSSYINCEGQPDKEVVANVWDTSDYGENPKYTSGKNLFAKGSTIIAGRHVNQFIGDIVSERSENGKNYNVTISDYIVSGNSYGKAKNNHQYASGRECEVVGCAYYVGVDINVAGLQLGHVYFCAGTLSFDSKDSENVTTLTEEIGQGNNASWTGGNFTNVKLSGFITKQKSYYPTYP